MRVSRASWSKGGVRGRGRLFDLCLAFIMISSMCAWMRCFRASCDLFSKENPYDEKSQNSSSHFMNFVRGLNVARLQAAK